MRCVNCDGELDPKRSWREIRAFERPKYERGAASGSSLIAREPTGRAICSGCATSIRHGVTPGQIDIFEELEIT